MKLGERLDEGQPDAEPSLRAVERAVGLGEEVEYPCEQLWVHSQAIVLHAKDHILPFDSSNEQDTSSGRRVFGGVRQ